MNPLQIEFVPSQGSTRVVLAGDINQHSDFTAVVADPSPMLVFDLRAVRRINSPGVREWIRLMDALRASGRALALEHCSVPFVNQMNMIVNFSGDGRVRSFYAPYLCVRCHREHAELCAVPEDGPPRLAASIVCPSCGDVAEFDDLPASYLAFAH